MQADALPAVPLHRLVRIKFQSGAMETISSALIPEWTRAALEMPNGHWKLIGTGGIDAQMDIWTSEKMEKARRNNANK